MKLKCLILAILVSVVCLGESKSHDNGPAKNQDSALVIKQNINA